MATLVTGGLGVNGVAVVRALLARSIPVVVFDASDDRSLLGELSEDVPVQVGDTRDDTLVARVVREHSVDTVIHLASLLTPASQADLDRALDVNVLGTRAVYRAAASAGVRRVIYASSKAAYGTITCEHGWPSYEPVTEAHPSRPRNFYDYCKLLSEGLGTAMSGKGQFEFAALRFATIYGPGKLQRHGPRALHGRIIEAGMSGRRFEVPQGRDQLDDLVYVDDVAEALVLAAVTETLRHPVYNVGTGRLVSIGDLADTVNRVFPGADVHVGPGLSPYDVDSPYFSRFDCSRAAADLGFTARHDLESGVRRYAEFFTTMGIAPWRPEERAQ
jgi:UDP-glucose 4-epimerase